MHNDAARHGATERRQPPVKIPVVFDVGGAGISDEGVFGFFGCHGCAGSFLETFRRLTHRPDCTNNHRPLDVRAMKRHHLTHEPLTRSVIGAFYEVYNTLGFGFLEHIYILALERELRSRGHQVRREAGVCVMYKGEELAYQRLDMLIDDVLIVEVKSTLELHKGANRQVYNYLRATNLEIGLLLHFGAEPKLYRSYRPKHRSGPSVASEESEHPFV